MARALNRLWRRAGSIFFDRFHARQLRSPREMRFDGWKEVGRNAAHSSARFLACARPWLLSVGWKRHGLIDPHELPLGSRAPE